MQTITCNIAQASERGWTNIVAQLLPHTDPAIENNRAIRDASYNGHTDVVKLLLQHPRVDPTAVDNEALLVACENGHVDIVELLISHPKIKQQLSNLRHKALRAAQDNERLEVVQLLDSISYL